MTHRSFRDNRGRVWEVWEVRPDAYERRTGVERRRAPRLTADRRQRPERRLVVPNELRQGWLVFASPTERRRLAPIPPNWAALSDPELQRLADDAVRLSHALRVAREGPT